MAFGMPQVGEPDLRPANAGGIWTPIEINAQYAAIVWLVLQQRVPALGRKIKDVFVGKQVKQKTPAGLMRACEGFPFL